jgi:hypothetical protein
MRWPLFLAVLLTWPVPLLGLEGSLVPVARFLQLAATLTVLIALEGVGGVIGLLLLLLWGHVLIYGSILFGVIWILDRYGLSRMRRRVGLGITLAVTAALIGWGTFARPYDTIFHHSDAHASLMEIYR